MATSNANLQDLPAQVHHVIFEFIDDFRDLCRLECTCAALRSSLSASDNDNNNNNNNNNGVSSEPIHVIWDEHYRQQWSYNSFQINGCLSQQPSISEDMRRCATQYTKQDFRLRYEKDQRSTQQLRDLITSPGRDIDQGMWDRKHEILDVIVREIQRCQDTNIGDDLDQRKRLMALFTFRCAAGCELAWRMPRSHGRWLENFSFAVTAALCEDLGTATNIFNQWLYHRQMMESLAKRIYPDDSMSKQSKFEGLQKLFRETFNGNVEDYYNVKNSMLGKVLETRCGIPMSLAILYKCLGARVGLDVEIIGLPGHIIIRVVDVDTYVDVFDLNVRILQMSDIRDIVHRYNLAFQEQYLQPLSDVAVFQRVCNNLNRCLMQFNSYHSLVQGVIVEMTRRILAGYNENDLGQIRKAFLSQLWREWTGK